MPEHDVVIIGGGIAGLRAAIAASDAGADTALLSMVLPVRSQSGTAQRGVNAALGNHPDGAGDTPEKHVLDTVRRSAYLADQDAVGFMCGEAPGAVRELESWGCCFSRTADGRIAQKSFSGWEFPRTCFGEDRTGLYILHTLYQQAVRRDIRVYEEYIALELARSDGRCAGVAALHIPTGKVAGFGAGAVVLATGGAGRVFVRTTNALTTTGSGMALAYRAGVPLKDMEFVQFSPTSVYGSSILIPEGALAEGGHLINSKGERFMERYAPGTMERSPPEVTSSAIAAELAGGRGIGDGFVHLDLRHLGGMKLKAVLPGIRELLMRVSGINPLTKPIPVVPAVHYTMGGIATDIRGATPMAGLYAAGECAAVSVHGANRLGGNSLLESLVFGKAAGGSAAAHAKGTDRKGAREAVRAAADTAEGTVSEVLARRGSAYHPYIVEAKRRLEAAMNGRFGLAREKKGMEEGMKELKLAQGLQSRLPVGSSGRKFNLSLLRVMELGDAVMLAEVVAASAMAREETRGAHCRTDFADTDNAKWLKHTLAEYTPAGPRLSYVPVTVTSHQPGGD